tara:strand:- start:3987 stop:4583 length:597 start_codon:yes stop_codon:yes gene_type:complete
MFKSDGSLIFASSFADYTMKSIPRDIILTTERLRLRAADLSDVDLVWDVSRFDGFNDGMTWEPPNSKEEIVAITERNMADWESGVDYIFTVEIKNDGASIGRVGLLKKKAPGIWNIGFWIHPKYWNRGFATEAARAILDFGFQRIEAVKITTDHATWNQQSEMVIRKLGFKYVGENPRGFIKNGQPVLVLEYDFSKQV